MQGMPFDMLIAQPLAESFIATGIAPDIPAAHDMAWNALRASLGTDPADSWLIKGMQHVYHPSPDAPGVQFQAEFLRVPDEQL